MAHDLVIRNGWIVDGTGYPKFFGDVAVRNGTIVDVGVLDGEPAGRTIDAEGLTVAPGFIDIHTHFDAQVTWDPVFESSCWHGITTIVMGNCGFGLAPCRPSDRTYLMSMLSAVEGMSPVALREGLRWEWESFPQYLDALGTKFPLGMNVGVLLAHSALRLYVMGAEARERAATPEETGRMRELAREALLAGAIGMSSSASATHLDHERRPVPSRLATHEEVIEVASVMRELNVGCLQHIALRSRDIALAIRRPVIGSGPVQTRADPGGWRRELDTIEATFEQGGQYWGQTLPGSPDMFFIMATDSPVRIPPFDHMPAWQEALIRPLAEKPAVLHEPGMRERMRADLKDPAPRPFSKDWNDIVVEEARTPENKRHEGRSIAQIARELGRDELDAFLDLALSEDLKTRFRVLRYIQGDMDAVRQIITSRYVLPGQSDAGAHLDRRCFYGVPTMMIADWHRQRGAMSLEEAVRRVTSLPASVFDLPGRGALRSGLRADIVIFDPARLRSLKPQALYDLPGGAMRMGQRSEGITHTIVNGRVFVENGRHTGILAGEVVRNRRATARAQ
jgi:N-acyl-D-aspartate/D-glutamate deacylase